MKKYQYFLLSLFLYTTNSAITQKLYVSGIQENTLEIYRFNIQSCELTNVCQVRNINFVSDITFDTNENLYVVNNKGDLRLVDTLSGISTFVHEFPNDNSNSYESYNAIVCDSENNIYVTGKEGHLYRYNLDTDVEEYLGNYGYAGWGDLIFFEGSLYVTSQNNEIIKLDLNNLNNSEVAVNNPMVEDTWGAVAFGVSCSNLEVYGARSNGNLVKIDLITGEVDLICQFPILIGGAASSVEFYGQNPLNIQDVITVKEPSCSAQDGEISIDITGGIGQIQYSINGNSFQSDNNVGNLGRGEYVIVVKDENDCTDEITFELFAENSLLLSNIDISQPTCDSNVGAFEVFTNSNSSSIQYSIDNINYQSSNTFTDLPIGNYTVYIKDENDCIDSQSVVINSPKLPFIEQIDISTTTCNLDNGEIAVVAQAGMPPYTYSLDNVSFQPQNTFSDLASGMYEVFVKDAEQCINSTTTEITVSEAVIIENITTNATSCGQNNGLIEVAVSINQVVEYSINGIDYQSTSIFSELPSGDYDVIIRDVNSCLDSQSVRVEASLPVQLPVVEVVAASCQLNNGQIILIPVSDNNDLSYSINGVDFQSEDLFSELNAGTYTIIVRNQDNCMNFIEVEVTDTPLLQFSQITTQSATCSSANGGFKYEVSGGLGQITVYLENEIINTSAVDNLNSGNYNLRIEDEAGCQKDTIVNIPRSGCPIYIPNAFSPNGDGINDRFAVQSHPERNDVLIRMQIFDRWGGLLFTGNGDDKFSWSGEVSDKPLDSGVYVYLIEIKNEAGEIEMFTDSVTLIR